ncbi:MAG: phage major capsid protein [Candidatus Heteroscillospira sp.]|jgi:hypothetical protein
MSYKFNEIKLDKGMYGVSGKGFAAVLEEMDPSEAYKGTAMEGMDAYQRQLKRFDIRVRGGNSDIVEKFFHSTDSAVLFPEYVSRSVRQGMEENNILPGIVAATTKIDGLDYRAIASVPTEDDKSMRHVAEGAVIPQTEIRAQDKLVKLHKRGRMLVASYEAIRFQKLELFSVMLRQIGNHIARMHLADAVEVIVSGDGNGNPAAVTEADALSYDELVGFWGKFDPYTMNTMLVSPDMMLAMLKLSELRNPVAGLNFAGTGEIGSPLGAKIIRSACVPEKTVIGLDRGYALEMVSAGDVAVEYDRLIDRQLERAAITSTSGFAKIYADASKILEIA